MDNCEVKVPLAHKQHVKYFLRFLNILPGKLGNIDSTRIMIAYFSVSGLDMLNSLDAITPNLRSNIIEWIYRLQVIPKEGDPPVGGFQGSSTLITDEYIPGNFQCGHLAMTYLAIGTLLTLGDDLSRLDKKAILEGVAAVQRPDGSFSATLNGSEADMRFAYCASAICTYLGDWGTVNRKAMADFVVSSIGYDYGIGQGPDLESHGGTTYCAIAALHLSDQLDILAHTTVKNLVRWLLLRQINGFNGRPNKIDDTCYSFWIGATLKILNSFQFSNDEKNRQFIMSTEDSVIGGFSKWPDSNTDPLHTYLGLCGLSLLGEEGLDQVQPSLNISSRAYKNLKDLHKTWDVCSIVLK